MRKLTLAVLVVLAAACSSDVVQPPPGVTPVATRCSAEISGAVEGYYEASPLPPAWHVVKFCSGLCDPATAWCAP